MRYIIEEKDLLDLLERSITLRMLENDGVDNWSWYGESYHDILHEYESMYNLDTDSLEDFYECAKLELEDYDKEVIK